MLFIHLVTVWKPGSMNNQDLSVRKWMVTSNTINVIGFILFYLSKYINSHFILYLSLLIFFSNGLLTLNYYFKTRKLRDKLNNYRRLINQFYIRLFFICFFIAFGIMILIGTVKL